MNDPRLAEVERDHKKIKNNDDDANATTTNVAGVDENEDSS